MIVWPFNSVNLIFLLNFCCHHLIHSFTIHIRKMILICLFVSEGVTQLDWSPKSRSHISMSMMCVLQKKLRDGSGFSRVDEMKE